MKNLDLSTEIQRATVPILSRFTEGLAIQDVTMDHNPDKNDPNKPGNGKSEGADSDDSSDDYSSDNDSESDNDSDSDDDNSNSDDDLGQDDDSSDSESEGEITTGVDGDCTSKTNLIKNSDFEGGNTSFTSTFIFDATCKGTYSPGAALQYSVNSTPSKCHVGYAPSTGDKGNILVVNFPSAGQAETKFWCQKVKVVKGKHYKISARLRAAVPSATESQPTEVTFTIDGKSVLATFRLEKDWKIHKSVEIPGASGEVELCGESRTQNVESTDLIADDFKFAECAK